MNKIEKSIIAIEEIKNYINNMQNLPEPNTYVLGFRLGVILGRLNDIQAEIVLYSNESKNKT